MSQENQVRMSRKIPFNKPVFISSSIDYIKDAALQGSIAGDGKYTSLCSKWIESKFSANKALLTTSCTDALEMTAILLNIQENDEVILPSFTFVSTASAFVLRGAKLVFVDIRPDTMNIDESLVEGAITKKTKAIVVVHYAGVACEMDTILNIAKRYGIPVVEDAAQGMMAKYKGKYLGTMGTFGCFSFHESKNYTMGEGGALLINDEEYIERAEIIREKGTNRKMFLRGMVDKYSWVDVGSSYLPSDINAAYLYSQLEFAEEINDYRRRIWMQYKDELQRVSKVNPLEICTTPEGIEHNAHIFYVKLHNENKRNCFISYMKDRGISCSFHYVPLHTSEAGRKFGSFFREDLYTTRESKRLVRLPIFYRMESGEIEYIIHAVNSFFEEGEK